MSDENFATNLTPLLCTHTSDDLTSISPFLTMWSWSFQWRKRAHSMGILFYAGKDVIGLDNLPASFTGLAGSSYLLNQDDNIIIIINISRAFRIWNILCHVLFHYKNNSLVLCTVSLVPCGSCTSWLSDPAFLGSPSPERSTCIFHCIILL